MCIRIERASAIAFALLVVAGSGLTVTGCAAAASGASPVVGTWYADFLGVFEGTYTYDTGAKTITLSNRSLVQTFTYEVSGNSLTLTDSESSSTTYTKQ